MRRLMLFTLLAVALPTAALASSIAVIPVTNPSFEMLGGHLNESCGHDCDFRRGSIPGWTSTGESGQLDPSTGHHGIFDTFAPHNGHISAFANSGTISQNVGTVVDDLIYTL